MAKLRAKDRKLREVKAKEEWETYEKGNFKFQPFEPLNPNQLELFNSCLNYHIVMALGPAGTAKSFCESSAAIKLLAERRVEKIMVTRSPVPTGKSTGFKPGESSEKMAPWVSPVMDNLRKAAQTESGSDGFFRYLKMTGKIEVVELESIKGSNLDNAAVIVEESQELDKEELMNLVTRIGENSRLFLNGDVAQNNKRVKGDAFKHYCTNVLEFNDYLESVEDEDAEEWMMYVPVIEFTKEDVVRSGVCRYNLELFARFGWL